MTALEKLMLVAMAEEGYLEKKSNAYLDDKTANAGKANYTKYWRDLKPEWQGQPWCDCFVGWCFMKAFGETVGNNLLCGGLRSYYTPTSAQCFFARGRLDKNPKAGDQVFFTKNGQGSGSYHTGIVLGVSAGRVLTIEGNTSGASGVVDNGGGVAKKSYSLIAYSGKMVFGHPDYASVPEEPKIKRVEDTKMTKLTKGLKGSAVRVWQAILNVDVTGVMDEATMKATVEWKQKHGLDDKRAVGDTAWRTALEGLKAK